MRSFFVVHILIMLLCQMVFAEQIPMGQSAGSALRGYAEEKQQEDIAQRLTEPKERAPSLDESELESLPQNAASVYINKVIIQSEAVVSKYIDKKDLNGLLRDYENRILTLRDMKILADVITQKIADERIRAYIPKQTFTSQNLYVNIVEK